MLKFDWLPDDDEANGPLSHCKYLPRPEEIKAATAEIRQQERDDMLGITSTEAWYQRHRAELRDKRAEQRARLKEMKDE